jgi:hypothetical protein
MPTVQLSNYEPPGTSTKPSPEESEVKTRYRVGISQEWVSGVKMRRKIPAEYRVEIPEDLVLALKRTYGDAALERFVQVVNQAAQMLADERLGECVARAIREPYAKLMTPIRGAHRVVIAIRLDPTTDRRLAESSPVLWPPILRTAFHHLFRERLDDALDDLLMADQATSLESRRSAFRPTRPI